MITNELFAQFASISYSENFSGRNARLGYQLKGLEIGLKYHINLSNYTDNEGFPFFRTYYSENILNRFGLFLGLKRDLIKLNVNNTVYIFGNADLNYIGRKMAEETFLSDTPWNVRKVKVDINSPPFFSSEINLGIGLRKKVTKGISCFAELGSGLVYIYSKGFMRFDNTNQVLFNFGGYNGIDLWAFQARVGLLMKLK